MIFFELSNIIGIISNLDMLGLITAKTVSRGRYGRSKEINSCIPPNLDPLEIINKAEPMFAEVFTNKYRHQSRL